MNANVTDLAVFDAYMRKHKAADRTIENYLGIIKRLQREVGSLLASPVLVKEKLDAWRSRVVRLHEAEKLASSTIRNTVAAIRRYYEACLEAGLCTENPAAELKSIGNDEGLPRPMPMPEVEQLIAAIPVSGEVDALRDRAMIELYRNGLRNVEVCRMDTDWVRYDVKEESLVLRIVGKGSREAEVVLHPQASEFLGLLLLARFTTDWQEWLAELSVLEATDRLCRRVLHGRQEPVFVHNSARLTRRQTNRIFAAYRDTAGLSDEWGPHSLRHTCGTELLEAEVDIRVVQEILRHKNIATTTLYTKVRLGPKAAAMRRLPMTGVARAGTLLRSVSGSSTGEVVRVGEAAADSLEPAAAASTAR